MLDELQQEFLAVIRGTAPRMALGPGKVDAARTWAIYRRNYLEVHAAALADTFSSVMKLVGRAFFRHIACAYVAQADSTSGDLNDYGAAFPAYLATQPACRTMPYLPDMARLDWAWFEVLQKARPALDWLPALLGLGPGRWPQAKATPACQWLASPFPIYDIWQLADDDAGTVDLGQGGQALLISRPGPVHVALLAPAEAAFVGHWFGGATLEASLEAALAVASGFDLHAHLTRLAQLQAVHSIESTS